VGIRSITDEGRKQAKKFGVRQIEMHSYENHRADLENLTLGEGCAGIYVSIDVDCLDPAFAPGGFSFWFGCELQSPEIFLRTEWAFVYLPGGLLGPRLRTRWAKFRVRLWVAIARDMFTSEGQLFLCIPVDRLDPAYAPGACSFGRLQLREMWADWRGHLFLCDPKKLQSYGGDKEYPAEVDAW
jgi:hypothetical protein